MSIRKIFFWLHLGAGIAAGLVILMMSVTGVLLTFERQLIAWSDREFRSLPPASGAPRAPLGTVISALAAAHPDAQPASVTVAAEPTRPIAVAAGQRTFYADAYTGVILGEGHTATKKVLSEIRAWHRWFALEGEQRALGRAATGWSTVLFAFLVLSGAYLWLPRVWTWVRIRAIALFAAGARGKARDFNWHNVVGIWSVVPLAIVVISALPISFPWANAAIYLAVGEPVPAGRGGGGGERARGGGGPPSAERPQEPRQRGGGAGARAASLDGLDTLLARAEQQERDWRTITLRLPASPTAPVALAIDRGDGGQPHLRSTLTLDRTTAVVTEYETFRTQTLGRRIRTTMRFAHTGEVLGMPGQLVAGVASAAGALLVWTGLSLALRRLSAWTVRRRRVATAARGASVIDSASRDMRSSV